MADVQLTLHLLCASPPEVSVSQLRTELHTWLARVTGGQDVVVTSRGRPVARLVPISTDTLFERWECEGLTPDAPGQRAVGVTPPASCSRRSPT